METILAALISAIASIVVAYVSRTPTRKADDTYAPRPTGPHHGRWVAGMIAIAFWLILAPIAIHHDFPDINMFALFVLTAAVAWFWPVNGWEAAAWVFGLHALNSVAEPLARMVGNYPYPPFSGFHVSLIWITTAIAFVNAFLIAVLCNWRLRKQRGGQLVEPASPNAKSESKGSSPSPVNLERPVAAAQVDISVQLERLAQLKAAGSLSESEFQAAKSKILGA